MYEINMRLVSSDKKSIGADIVSNSNNSNDSPNKNREYWAKRTDFWEAVGDVEKRSVERFEGAVEEYAFTREATTNDVVCLDTRMIISHTLYIDRLVSQPAPSGGSIKSLLLDMKKKRWVSVRKRKAMALLYGVIPLKKIAPYIYRMERFKKGKGVKVKKLVVGIANPINHRGAIAFAIVRYQPYIYYPSPIDDFGLFVGDIELVGWGYVPSREEVSTAVGTCLRKVAELNELGFVGVDSVLVEERSLILGPTTEAEEVILSPRNKTDARMLVYVWGVAKLPLKEADLFFLR